MTLHDEFTALPITKLQRLVMRRHKAKRCIACGKQPLANKYRCHRCAVIAREAQRKRTGAVKRYPGARSYQKKFSRAD